VFEAFGQRDDAHAVIAGRHRLLRERRGAQQAATEQGNTKHDVSGSHEEARLADQFTDIGSTIPAFG
jgi:hypothetical protein